MKGTVSHVSDNVYSGHYVGKVREKGDRWLRYDDEKVTESRVKKTENYSKLIYILFYERSKE